MHKFICVHRITSRKNCSFNVKFRQQLSFPRKWFTLFRKHARGGALSAQARGRRCRTSSVKFSLCIRCVNEDLETSYWTFSPFRLRPQTVWTLPNRGASKSFYEAVLTGIGKIIRAKWQPCSLSSSRKWGQQSGWRQVALRCGYYFERNSYFWKHNFRMFANDVN